ncbi:hypothetical protein [Moorena sp. SIO4E2]|uniref:hypothetical protein n=1 Tax=Moorena sp. SIO4E2 TaxID=2607826 RepID=UPI00257E3218|nr:hypothetical protein [Moorena sp. SIO4E2]
MLGHSVVRTAWPKAKACAMLLEVLIPYGHATILLNKISCSRRVSLGRWPRYANSLRLTADG